MLRALICVCLLLAGPAAATSIAPKSLEELVPEAGEVVVATIEAVDVIDADGRALQGEGARTGPGLDNRMRLHLRVEEVIHPRGAAVPQERMVVPLWQMWHYDLDSMQDVVGRRAIFLLQAGSHEPVYPAYFQRRLEERAQIEALLPAPDAAPVCGPAGAYGIAFGDRPARGARRQPGSGKATTWYAVTPPRPDARFDRYLAGVDTGTGTIYQVDAVRTIIPKERSVGLTAAQREEGVRQAEAFAQDYLATLPPGLRSQLVDERGTSHWEGAIADGTWMEVDVDFSWEVTVSCRDLAGERVMGERVLPGMFK